MSPATTVSEPSLRYRCQSITENVERDDSLTADRGATTQRVVGGCATSSVYVVTRGRQVREPFRHTVQSTCSGLHCRFTSRRRNVYVIVFLFDSRETGRAMSSRSDLITSQGQGRATLNLDSVIDATYQRRPSSSHSPISMSVRPEAPHRFACFFLVGGERPLLQCEHATMYLQCSYNVFTMYLLIHKSLLIKLKVYLSKKKSTGGCREAAAAVGSC